MRIKLLALVALTAVATACSKSDELSAPSNFPADGVIRIAANVQEPQTRAGWDNTLNPFNGDFNIWITPQGETAGSPYIYQKKKMNYSKNSAWTAYEWTDYTNTTPLTLLWKNSKTPVDVIAWYFQNAAVESEDVTTIFENYIFEDQSHPMSVAGSDLLYFKGTVNPAITSDATDAGGKVTQYALVGGKIRIPFRHINSKLDLTVTLGTEMNVTPGTTTNPITDIKVNGTDTDFSMNISTGVITKTPNDGSTSITPWHNAAGYVAGNAALSNAVAKYECILIPQTVEAGDFTVSFTIGGKEYIWTSADAVTLARGTAYDLELTVGTATTTRSAAAAGDTATVTGILSASQLWNK